MKTTLEKVQEATKSSPARYLVRNSVGAILGMLEKYNNTRTEKHPWKAVFGIGEGATYLGAYYSENGGKRAAVQHVVGASCGMAKLDVRVASVSSNTNAFGLTGIILMANDGRTWEVGRCQHPVAWTKGQTLFFPVDIQGSPRFYGCEIPRFVGRAPQAVIDEVWGSR